MSKNNATQKNSKKTAVAQNVALNEAHKALRKAGKKPVASPKVVGSKKSKVVRPTPAMLDGLMSRVEAQMKGKSTGTIESAKALIRKVCEKYDVICIDADLAAKAREDYKNLPPKSRGNMYWAIKIGVAAGC